MEESIKEHFIVDASFVLAFLLKENQIYVNEIFQKFRNSKLALCSSSLLKYEVGNTLKTALLRRKITPSMVKKLYISFLEYGIEEEKVDWLKTLNIAIKNNLSFYDASYLSLSKKLHYPLLTLDSSLKLINLPG